MSIIREKCVETFAEIERAALHAADRIELCARLDIGGTTPSLEYAEFALSKNVRTVVMIRNRPDFLITPSELTALEAEMKAFSDTAISGFVFGFLTPEQTLDVSALQRLLKLRSGKEAVFHMAFDEIPKDKQFAALDMLIRLGFTRVLTKGGHGKASDNSAHLKALAAYAAGKIELLAGGGVTDANYRALHDATGITQFHGRKLAGN